MSYLKYSTKYGGNDYSYKVQLNIRTSSAGNQMDIGVEADDGSPFFGLTRVIPEFDIPPYSAFIDVFNVPDALNFIEDNELGEVIGYTQYEFVEYPLVQFDEVKLAMYAPDKFSYSPISKAEQEKLVEAMAVAGFRIQFFELRNNNIAFTSAEGYKSFNSWQKVKSFITNYPCDSETRQEIDNILDSRIKGVVDIYHNKIGSAAFTPDEIEEFAEDKLAEVDVNISGISYKFYIDKCDSGEGKLVFKDSIREIRTSNFKVLIGRNDNKDFTDRDKTLLSKFLHDGCISLSNSIKKDSISFG